MSELKETFLEAGKRKLRALTGGQGSETALFLHGGVAGEEFYASGAHIWGESLAHLGKDRRIVVIDLPGSAEGIDDASDFSVEAISAALAAAIDDGPVHFVGHELGAMVGVHLAITKPRLIRSLSIVTSPMTAPTADAVSNVSFNNPPLPRLSRVSQEWALEHLSHSHFHITPALLDACVAAADADYQRRIAEIGADAVRAQIRQSMRRTQLLQWETCRGDGLSVPVQVIWAAQDPLTSRAANYLLFSTIAAKQQAAQFHIVNRAGALPFRDQAEVFASIVAAFQDGVAAKSG